MKLEKVDCFECGKPTDISFKRKYPMGYFCSDECEEKFRASAIMCDNCGKITKDLNMFMIENSGLETYCCKDCKREYLAKHENLKNRN